MRGEAIILLVLFFGAGCTGSGESTVDEAVAPSIEAKAASSQPPIVTEASKKLFEERCSVCHSLDRPAARRKTYDGWLQTVYRMTAYGAEFTDEEAKSIAAYLAREYEV